MDTLMNFIAENRYSLLGAGAALSGVALMSLVMGRTARRRQEEAQGQDS